LTVPVKTVRDLVDHVATGYLGTARAPGLSIACAHGAEPILASAYGESDAGTRETCTADTAFCVGSITKQFTAASVLVTAAAGRLDIDEDVAAFFPRKNLPRKGVSLRNLLSHTAGLSSGAESAFCAGEAFTARPEDILALPSDAEPGVKWCYCNAGFAIAARIIEEITGEEYNNRLVLSVFEAARLERTSVGPPNGDSSARGHARTPGGFGYVRPVTPLASFGSGDIYSTAADLVRWFNALSEGQVVPSELYCLMKKPFVMKSGEAASYGLGMFVGQFGGTLELSQDGNSGGFSSQLACYPDQDLVVAALTNGSAHDAEGIEKSIARNILSIPDQIVLDLEAPASELAAYSGDYSVGAAPVSIWADCGALFISKPNGHVDRLLNQGSGIFVERDTPNVRICFDAGEVTVRRNGKTLAVLEKSEPIANSTEAIG
jgi:CubicO group peptidase (beta-lactamase class C family)